MAATYGLGVFNDSLFRQAVMLLALHMGMKENQGTVMTVFTLPYILFAWFAGWLGDRFSKRHVVIGSKLLELLAMVCGAVGICRGDWPLVMAMVFVMALQSCLFGPALNGSIPELYPAAFVPKANARLKVVTTAMILLGVSISSLAMDYTSETWWSVPAGRVVVGFAAVGIALLGVFTSFGVPRRPAAAPHAKLPWRGPVDTVLQVAAIHKDSLLAVTMYANAFIWTIGALFIPLVNVMATEQFGYSDRMAGLLLAAEVVGLAVGGLIGGRIARSRSWTLIMPVGLMGVALLMMLMAAVPVLPGAGPVLAAFALLGLIGIVGGMVLVPSASFVQVRPAPERKGTVLASVNFVTFCGIALSGQVANVLNANMQPTRGFGTAGVVAFLVGLWLCWALRAHMGEAINSFTMWFTRSVLWLRYRVRMRGVEAVAEKGTSGILFLPNHPALIDPVILMSRLYGSFRIRALADEAQIDRFFVRSMAARMGVLPIPDMTRPGAASAGEVREVMARCVQALRNGDNLLLYPAGRIYRGRMEDLAGNSAAETILKELPGVRIVLVRTRGLWGSAFSRASASCPTCWESCCAG